MRLRHAAATALMLAAAPAARSQSLDFIPVPQKADFTMRDYVARLLHDANEADKKDFADLAQSLTTPNPHGQPTGEEALLLKYGESIRSANTYLADLARRLPEEGMNTVDYAAVLRLMGRQAMLNALVDQVKPVVDGLADGEKAWLMKNYLINHPGRALPEGQRAPLTTAYMARVVEAAWNQPRKDAHGNPIDSLKASTEKGSMVGVTLDDAVAELPPAPFGRLDSRVSAALIRVLTGRTLMMERTYQGITGKPLENAGRPAEAGQLPSYAPAR